MKDAKTITTPYAALMLGISPITLKRYYKWFEENGGLIKLGMPIPQKDNRGTWYFSNEDIKVLAKFRANLKRGEMAEFNKQFYKKKRTN